MKPETVNDLLGRVTVAQASLDVLEAQLILAKACADKTGSVIEPLEADIKKSLRELRDFNGLDFIDAMTGRIDWEAILND